MVGTNTKEELRYTLVVNGVRSVMICGTTPMLLLFASNWDTQKVHT